MNDGIFRAMREGGTQAFDGVVDATLFGECDGQVTPGIGEFRFDLRGRFVMEDRIVVLTSHLQGEAECVVPLRMAMIDLQELMQEFDGFGGAIGIR